MLVIQQNTWLQQLLVWRGSALQRIWPRLFVVTAFSSFITVAHHWFEEASLALTPLPFSLVGVALGIFLGFRNNASYDRFWEGRKLWGELVNLCRTWSRQVLTLVDRDVPSRPSPRQEQLVLGAVAFAHVMRQHLRDEQRPDELGELARRAGCDAILAARHRPNAAVLWLGDRIADAARHDAVDRFHVTILDRTLAGFTNVLGACERIKNTPIPGSYTVLIHRIVALYVFGMPFGLLAATGVFTPLVVLFIAYAFLGLDAIGGEIENPFGYDPNDLPLSAITRTIEIDLREQLGDPDLPPPAAAIDDVLS